MSLRKSDRKSALRLVAELSKSGIVTLVVMSVLAGYLVGHPLERPFEFGHLTLTLVGILFLASGSSALNQWQERELDRLMPRTQNRPIPSGDMTAGSALALALSFLFVGGVMLWRIDMELLWLGIAAAVSYNGLYTLWWKRKWPYAAIPGAIPGALPALMGFVAAHRAESSWLEPGGWYLFALLFFWQMPHFWILALRYSEDYAQGAIPTLPVSRGSEITRIELTLWALGYIGISFLAPLFLPVGRVYLSLAVLVAVLILRELFRLGKEIPSGLILKDRTWLRFFLLINFSLVIYLFGLAADLWSVYLIPALTR